MSDEEMQDPGIPSYTNLDSIKITPLQMTNLARYMYFKRRLLAVGNWHLARIYAKMAYGIDIPDVPLKKKKK